MKTDWAQLQMLQHSWSHDIPKFSRQMHQLEDRDSAEEKRRTQRINGAKIKRLHLSNTECSNAFDMTAEIDLLTARAVKPFPDICESCLKLLTGRLSAVCCQKRTIFFRLKGLLLCNQWMNAAVEQWAVDDEWGCKNWLRWNSRIRRDNWEPI